ncbi:MAG: sensor histidine kinase [Proteobacteria bacterium]|nr:sensor histidine kinase [Pseudomonadota bacterium]
MSPSTEPTGSAADEATRELARLQRQIAQARAQLADLQRQVAQARADRDGDRQARLADANDPRRATSLVDKHARAMAAHERQHSVNKEASTQLAGDHARAMAAHERQHSESQQANMQLVDDHALAMAAHERQHSENKDASTQLVDSHELAMAAHERQHSENKDASTQLVDSHELAMAAHERQHSENKDANTQLVDGHELEMAAHERQHTQQQEANTQLILAALDARDLQVAAELAQRRQTDFLAVLAHELRNPLAPIRSAASLLGMSGSDETLLPRLREIIERQVTHMSRLVGDLLDVSRASTGKLRLEREVIEMGRIIDEAIDACRPAVLARGQRLDVTRPPTGLEVCGDPVRLAQVLGNLLDNASKYTPEGGSIGLAAVVVDQSLVITVSDTGIGITAEALSQVFEPFVQEPHATGFNSGGLGIGLTVVSELIQAHGGTVTASSAGSGQGSQFVVTLPLFDREHP